MAQLGTHIHPVGDALTKLFVDASPTALLEHLSHHTNTDDAPRHELAHRTSDGIEVTLLWCACHDTVAVQVADHGNLFEVVVARDRALDAFYHPYAYAAQQGLEYEVPVLRAA